MEKLGNFKVVATDDLDQARSAVASTYLQNHLTKLSRHSLRSRLNASEDHDFTVGYLTYSAEVSLQMPPSEDFYHVNLTIGGHTDAWREDRQTCQTARDGFGVVLVPDRLSRVTWSSDAEQVIFRFSRQRLETHLARLIGRDVTEPIRFDLGLDLRTPAGSSLYFTALHMVQELDRLKSKPGFAQMIRPMEELVMTQFLFASTHSFRDCLDFEGSAPTFSSRGGGLLRDPRVQRVLEYIELRLGDAITLEELASVGAVSIRRLHALFRSDLETSPQAYIQERRLESVRSALEKGIVTDSVGRIASDFGFIHMGRFAALYRKRYGELPSATLRRLSTA